MGARVAIAIPSHDMVHAVFSHDLVRMAGFHIGNFVGPDQPISSIELYSQTGTYIHRARQTLAEVALKQGVDAVLWLDADMRFPKDLLIRLMQHDKDVVGINYSKRGIPPAFVAAKRLDPPEPLVTDEDSEGLEEVEGIGFGAVLMKTRVFHALPSVERLEKPWFWYDWDGESHTGEDIHFCQLLGEAGVDIHVDHDLSKECSHVGTLEYTTDHPLAMMEEGLVGAG